MTQWNRIFVCTLAVCAAGHLVTIPRVAFGQRAEPDRDTTARVQAIRTHYTRINTESKRYTKKERDLSGFSTEGGVLIGYYRGNDLRKMVATYYGESGKTIKEFYFTNGALFFVLSTDIRYVRPLHFDGKDTGAVASATKNRFYFDKGVLIQWIGPTGKPQKTDNTEGRRESNEIRASATDLLTRLRSPPTP